MRACQLTTVVAHAAVRIAQPRPPALFIEVAATPANQQEGLDAWLAARTVAAEVRANHAVPLAADPDGRGAAPDECRRAVIAQGAFFPLHAPPAVTLVRLGAARLCCVGQLPLRVALLRLVRARRPHEILLLVDGARGRQVADWLAAGGAGFGLDVTFDGEGVK